MNIPAGQTRAWATIDLQALQHNFSVARACNPSCSIVAVIKADAYGHGLLAVAAALDAVMRPGDVFGVATLDEALKLQPRSSRGIVLLEGVHITEELAVAVQAGLQLAIHSPYQLDQLQRLLQSRLQSSLQSSLQSPLQQKDPTEPTQALTIWLKLDTGMHRLGLSMDEFDSAYRRLKSMQGIGQVILMSHLACADDLIAPATQRQLAQLNKTMRLLEVTAGPQCPVSVAASAGILAWPQTHFQWLRPGIMLYGGSAILGEDGVERDLKPVMTLRSRVIAIKDVQAGSAIGYGATYVCPGSGRLAIVSIGYGDGYPRHAPNGTPVLLHCAASIVGRLKKTRIVGRVSMDMIAVDVSEIHDAAVGDEVVLWGEGLPADQVARLCGTISYELFCQVTGRVNFIYQ